MEGKVVPGKVSARLGGEALRQSEERFRLMVEAVKDYGIFLLDPTGHIASWNEGAERLKGYRADEIIGKHFSVFYPAEALARGWPEYELEVAAKTGRFEDEGWRIRKDGTLFWANVVITTLRNERGELIGFAKVTRDLTERRRQEERLRQSEERFRLMVEAVKDYGIFLLDPTGHIASWNEGAQRIKGYTADEVIGRHFSIFYPPEAIAKAWPAHELQVAQAEGRFEDEGWRVRKDGSLFWANVVITTLRTQEGKLLGFTKVTRDLTDRRAQEEALRDSQVRLSKSNIDLAQRNSDLQDFAYVAGHDLQEPLRKISSFAELLEQEERAALSEQGRMYVDRIRGSAQRMSAFLKGLLAYSRVATNADPFQRVDLNRVATEVAGDLQISLEERRGRVEVGALPTVEADPTQMRQLFQNLISNGLKFHREGVPPVVRLRSSVVEGAACIVVEDNGIGFDEKHADQIFAPFHRLHGRGAYEGSGLGLAICKRIAERHEGTISAHSRPGEGARFTVCLPLGRRATPANP